MRIGLRFLGIDTAEDHRRSLAHQGTAKGPGTRLNAMTETRADATDIFAFDKDGVWDGDTWWYPVEWHGFRGYVGGSCFPLDQ